MTDVSSDRSVPLRVLWPHEFDRSGEWAVGGVPFARGELDPSDDVGVRADGRVLPVQTRVLAYWPDGSVKWLLVATACDLVVDDGAAPRLFVEPSGTDNSLTSDGAVALSEEVRLRFERTDDAVRVDTGPLEFSVPLDDASILDSAAVRGRRVIGGGDRPELFVEIEGRDGGSTRYSDREGAVYRTVEVEEDGPYRAVIAITGTHVAADGSTFAPYTVRLYAFAGDSHIRVSHTFVYDGDPDADLIRSVGVRVPTAVERPRHFAYGGNVKPATRSSADRSDDWKMGWRRGELYQASPTDYRFEKRVEPDRPPVTVERGRRADGWAALGTRSDGERANGEREIGADGEDGSVGADDRIDAGLAVAVRHAWQNAPTSIRADAATGEITAFLHPERADPIDLRWYSETAYGHVYESPGTTVDRNSPRVPTMNAHGISKTHELLLAFRGPGDSDEDLAERVRAFDDPPRVTVSPERYADTEVLGTYAASAPAGYEDREAWIEEGLDYILQEQEFRGWYGTFDYGDVVRAYDEEIHQWTSDQGGHGWLNTEFQPDQWLWFGFLLTGRYDVFRFAEAMARHTTDVDVLHAGPWWGFGSRHGVQHWSDGDREVRVSMPGGRRLHYYLTGDERTRDAIELAVRRYRTMQREPGRTWMGFREELYTRTDALAALYAYYVAWEMTGEDRYEDLVRNVARTAYCELHPLGAPYNRCRMDLSTGEGEPLTDGPIVSSNMFLQFGGAQVLFELADLGEFPEVRDAVLSYADYLLLPHEARVANDRHAKEGLHHRIESMPLHAFAYRETGDEAHREALEAALARPEVTFGPAPWDEEMLAFAGAEGYIDCITGSLASFGRKAPYGFAALDDDSADDASDHDEPNDE